MKLTENIHIDASAQKVWQIISDIENSQNNIEAIENIEVLEKPENGLVGLKWIETRKFFGKSATETMWVTHAEENKYYQTRAESHGSIYKSRMDIEEDGNGCKLTMSFDGQPQTFGAKVMNGLMGWMAKGSLKKTIAQDLENIKQRAESHS